MGKLRDLFNQFARTLHVRNKPVNPSIETLKQSTQSDATQSDESSGNPIRKNSYADMIFKESHNDIKEAIDHLHNTLEHLNFPITKKKK